MNPGQRRERFRAILAADQCIQPATVFDPISARIAENLGFAVGFMPGRVAAATVLGYPDLALLTSSEFAEQVHRICRASSISLMVDADHGYGNALNVMRTVEELETAGLSALSIEDTVLPLGFGHKRGDEALIPLEEAVGKLKAALAARQDPSLVIVARTRAPVIGGTPETVRRAKAYEKAGADALFLAGTKTRQEVAEVHAETKLPLIVVQQPMNIASKVPELADLGFLAGHGVRIASPGHFVFLASVKAVQDVLKAVHDGKSVGDLGQALASASLLAQVTWEDQHDQWIEEFLN